MSPRGEATSSSGGTIHVIGAGIVGLCIAWHLQKQGARVLLIDRNEPAKGCSFGNAGALSGGSVAPLAMPGVMWTASGMLLDSNGPIHVPFHYWLKAAPWLRRFIQASRPTEVARIADALTFLLSDAITHHQEILDEVGRPELIRVTGQLHLYRNTAQMRSDEASWTLRREHGLLTQVLGRDEFLELEPRVGPAYQVGVFTPDQGMSVSPYQHALAIAHDFVQGGGRILKEEALAIEVSESSVSGIVTSGGYLPAHRVVVCAGAWSTNLLRPLGYAVPLESQRGYHVMVAGPDCGISRPVVLADRKVFVTPMQEGVRAAGTVEFGGLDLPPTSRRAELLSRHFAEAFPDLAGSGSDERWMGHRPCLPDSLPVLGESDWHRGLWFAFGHGHLGLTSAAKTGRLIAQSMFANRNDTALEPFSIHRFPRIASRRAA